MKYRTNFPAACLTAFILTFLVSGLSAVASTLPDSTLTSADGPYVWYQKDGSVRIISTDLQGLLKDTTYRTLPDDFMLSVTSSDGEYHFQVPLRPVQRPSWQYPQPEKVFVISDPHGWLDDVVTLLQRNGVIDSQLQWSYGTNHLVIIGDVFDRGNDVTSIFWLIYKLEHEAAQAGGCVSFLLGNHETLVLAGDLRYCTPHYHALAQQLDLPYSRLFGADTELGRWLATRNTLQVIGRDLYVHAGLSQEFYEWRLSIPVVNEAMSQALFLTKDERKQHSALTAFLYGNTGPVWYRGLVRDAKKYDPISSRTLQRLLKRYGVRHIIVGHTIFDDVSTFHRQRVIDVNVNHPGDPEKGLKRGLLIEGKTYRIVGTEDLPRALE